MSPKEYSSAVTETAVDWTAELSRHDRWLRTVVFARSPDPDTVDDIMQEVALAAVAQSSPLRSTDRIAPWLYQLAVRLALLHRRRMGRERRKLGIYAVKGEIDNTAQSEPVDWLLKDERREFVRIAVGELPPKEREILLLKYTADWSYRQLSDRLGITEKAVESRLDRARKRLREKLLRLNVAETD